MNCLRPLMAVVAASMALLSGCDRAERDWREAQKTNTFAAYNAYRTNYPKNAHVAEARSGVEKLEWREAQSKGTIEAYETYLKSEPDGAHAADAHSRAESLDWTSTVSAGPKASSAYVAFHRKYPGSDRVNAITADLECSQNIAISFGSGFTGSMSLSSLTVNVKGHKELSGEYLLDQPGTKSLIDIYERRGGTIGPLPKANLLVAEFKGRRRIVAVESQ